MGDWDYINKYLGGHDEDGLPNFMSEPGFADEEKTQTIHLDEILFKVEHEAKTFKVTDAEIVKKMEQEYLNFN